jgi:hypothetical protein
MLLGAAAAMLLGCATTAPAMTAFFFMARLGEGWKREKGYYRSGNQQFLHISCPKNCAEVTGAHSLSSLCCNAILWSAHE